MFKEDLKPYVEQDGWRVNLSIRAQRERLITDELGRQD